MGLIKAVKKDAELIAEMDALVNDDAHFHLWWLGQSGFLLQWKGIRVLIDPYLSDSLTNKYLATDKPHTRMSELVVNPGLLKNISIVTSSHNHTDHLDAQTLIPVLKNNPEIKFIIAPHETGEEHLKDIEKLFRKTIRYSTLVNMNGITEMNTLIIDNIGMLSRLASTYSRNGGNNDARYSSRSRT